MRRLCLVVFCLSLTLAIRAEEPASGGKEGPAIDATTLRGKVLAGYQGWFRCPGDATNQGWYHWCKNYSTKIMPETLTVDLWPDVSEYAASDRYPAPGFTHPGGEQAYLFSSDSESVVRRHFEWMRDYGLDGAWVQQFLVGLPGGSDAQLYDSHCRVVQYICKAARETGRVWALSYDAAGMPIDKIYELMTRDWKKMVDDKVVSDPRYLHHQGLPVVQFWGYYFGNKHNQMNAELANKIIDFFQKPGPYAAFLVGGGDWNWRANPDPKFRAVYNRLGAYVPWNVGHRTIDASGASHADTSTWAGDRRECTERGELWIPVVYPGFTWDHLTKARAGSSLFPRRGGQFFWEQFHELSKHAPDSVFIAMFDEVDEGTAIFKVTSTPPVETYFVGYEGLPSDWYLRLAGEGARLLKEKKPVPERIPLKP